jgi:hypothetical protein
MKRLVSWLLVRYVEGLIHRRNAQLIDEREARLSNCLEAALAKFYAEGGWIIIGRSESHPLLPHAAHAKELPLVQVTSFAPGKNRVYGWRAFWRSPAFRGMWIDGLWGGARK